MAASIVPISFPSPGIFGLNTEEENQINDAQWAVVAQNLILDETNTLASRNGYVRQNANSLSGDVESICEYVREGASNEILFGVNNNLYKNPSSPSSIYSTSITADNWKIINFNGSAYFFQEDHHPLVYNGTTCQKIVDSLTDWAAATGYVIGDVVTPTTPNNYYYVCTAGGTSHATTEPTWPTTVGNTVTDNTVTWECQEIKKGTDAFSAFGRIWMVHGDVVYGSDLLQGNKWSGGSAGYVDMTKVWPGGTDQAVAVAEYANKLVVFGSRNIAIYTNAEDPLSMALEDVISNIGCISRDSIQSTGTDLLFLSYTGVRSLMRTIIEKNLPLTDMSKNVRSSIDLDISLETDLQLIKSVYSATDSFYLLSFPTSNNIWCFDTRPVNNANGLRVTKWDTINPTSMCTTEDNSVYFGQTNYVSKYSTYYDNGETIEVQYYSPYMDLGVGTSIKIPKSVRVTLEGTSGTDLILYWSFNYSDTWKSRTKEISFDTGSIEYGIGEYGIGEYSSPLTVFDAKYNIGGTGTTIKFGLVTDTSGSKVRFQRLDAFFKQGKQYLNT